MHIRTAHAMVPFRKAAVFSAALVLSVALSGCLGQELPHTGSASWFATNDGIMSIGDRTYKYTTVDVPPPSADPSTEPPVEKVFEGVRFVLWVLSCASPLTIARCILGVALWIVKLVWNTTIDAPTNLNPAEGEYHLSDDFSRGVLWQGKEMIRLLVRL